LTVTKEKHPVILNENFRIPEEDLRRSLQMMLKNSINFKKFDEFSYTYEVSDPVFSSKLYQSIAN
jgi:hypothetical protein